MPTFEIVSMKGETAEVMADDAVKAAGKFNQGHADDAARVVREIQRGPDATVLCNCPGCGRAILVSEVNLSPVEAPANAPAPKPAAPVAAPSTLL